MLNIIEVNQSMSLISTIIGQGATTSRVVIKMSFGVSTDILADQRKCTNRLTFSCLGDYKSKLRLSSEVGINHPRPFGFYPVADFVAGESLIITTWSAPNCRIRDHRPALERRHWDGA